MALEEHVSKDKDNDNTMKSRYPMGERMMYFWLLNPFTLKGVDTVYGNDNTVEEKWGEKHG